ncbi:uncharacterized protein LOC144361657 [Saccoglossus kowalevskii]
MMRIYNYFRSKKSETHSKDTSSQSEEPPDPGKDGHISIEEHTIEKHQGQISVSSIQESRAAPESSQEYPSEEPLDPGKDMYISIEEHTKTHQGQSSVSNIQESRAAPESSQAEYKSEEPLDPGKDGHISIEEHTIKTYQGQSSISSFQESGAVPIISQAEYKAKTSLGGPQKPGNSDGPKHDIQTVVGCADSTATENKTETKKTKHVSVLKGAVSQKSSTSECLKSVEKSNTSDESNGAKGKAEGRTTSNNVIIGENHVSKECTIHFCALVAEEVNLKVKKHELNIRMWSGNNIDDPYRILVLENKKKDKNGWVFDGECRVDGQALKSGIWYRYYIGNDQEYINGQVHCKYYDRLIQMDSPNDVHFYDGIIRMQSQIWFSWLRKDNRDNEVNLTIKAMLPKWKGFMQSQSGTCEMTANEAIRKQMSYTLCFY